MSINFVSSFFNHLSGNITTAVKGISPSITSIPSIAMTTLSQLSYSQYLQLGGLCVGGTIFAWKYHQYLDRTNDREQIFQMLMHGNQSSPSNPAETASNAIAFIPDAELKDLTKRLKPFIHWRTTVKKRLTILNAIRDIPFQDRDEVTSQVLMLLNRDDAHFTGDLLRLFELVKEILLIDRKDLIKKILGSRLKATSLETKIFILKHLMYGPLKEVNTLIEEMADILNKTPDNQVNQQERSIKNLLLDRIEKDPSFHVKDTSPFNGKEYSFPICRAPAARASEANFSDTFERDGDDYKCTSPFSGKEYSIPIYKAPRSEP